MLRSSLLVLAVLLASVAELAAQQIPPLEGNQRIRVSTATAQEVGYVGEITQDSLVIWRAYGLGELRMPLAAIERLEVSCGFLPAGVQIASGALLGLALGVVAGAILGYSGGDDPPCGGLEIIHRCSYTAAEKARIGGFWGGLLGGSGGGVIGALLAPAERWEQVVPPLRAGVAPHREGGVAVVVSRQF